MAKTNSYGEIIKSGGTWPPWPPGSDAYVTNHTTTSDNVLSHTRILSITCSYGPSHMHMDNFS